jgi:DNA-binding transcriptional regulator YiaG
MSAILESAASSTAKAASATGALASPLTEAGEVEIAGRRYITPQRLADLLRVSVRTLARWDARRIGPPKITIGKTILFDIAKVPDWLASRETQLIRNARR